MSIANLSGSLLLTSAVLAVSAASVETTARTLGGATGPSPPGSSGGPPAGGSGRPPAVGSGRPPGGAPGHPPGGAPGRPTARPAHALWYRLEFVANGQFWHDDVWEDSSPAASTVSYSDHDMRSSKWSATSAGAFILNRHRGRLVTFYANLIGKVENARRSETITTTTGDMSAVPNQSCTTTLTEKLFTPVGLTGVIRQYGQPNQLAFLVTPFPHTGNYVQTVDYCFGQTFVDSCPDGGLDCGSIYLGGGQPSALDPKDRARRLAFKLPSRAHFGHSFSIQRTVARTLSFPADPPREGTDMYRSRVDYALNFTACPRHGRDVQNC